MKVGAALRLEDVSVSFSHVREPTNALEAVSLDIAPGEFIAIVGPSGCGKSTILNLVAGLLEPTQGRVLMDGEPIHGVGPDRLVVFQEGALFPWLDVEANVAFGLRRAGMPQDQRRRRVREALELVQLGDFADSRIHELSGGMRQRVAVARALVMDPRVLLMDEPFANLDAQTREDLQQKVEEIWRSRRPTVVFITHDVREAAFLADRIVVMSHRPGTIRTIIPVEAPRPRRHDDRGLDRAEAAARKVLTQEFAWQREQELKKRA